MGEVADAPATIEDVIQRMRRLDARLASEDGFAWFNRLYLRVTERVHEALEAGVFQVPRFLVHLDVTFATLYFGAEEAARTGGTARAPAAWAPLVEMRSRSDIAPVQFAFAGMEAHIGYHLPMALVETSAALGCDLARDSAPHDDFQRVNGILAGVEDEVKDWFASSYPSGSLLGRLEEQAALWSVAEARERAWTAAEELAALGDAPAERERFLRDLGAAVGQTACTILQPTGGRATSSP